MPITIDERVCVPVDKTLGCKGQGFGCRGNKIATDCLILPPCDPSVEIVRLVSTPIILPQTPQVEARWLGEAQPSQIRVLITMSECANGTVHDVNYMQVFPDGALDAESLEMVGNTLNDNYRYLFAIRRERGGLASTWTTVWMGAANHQRAFSGGYAVGYQ